MKQTAVEFLLDELPKLAALSDFLEKEDFIKARTMIFEQAKEMEHQQITDSYKIGARYALISQSDLALIKGKFPTPEQYYNETFKSE